MKTTINLEEQLGSIMKLADSYGYAVSIDRGAAPDYFAECYEVRSLGAPNTAVPNRGRYETPHQRCSLSKCLPKRHRFPSNGCR